MAKIGDKVILSVKFEELHTTSIRAVFGVSNIEWKKFVVGQELTISDIRHAVKDWDGYRAERGTYSFKEHDMDWVFPIEWFAPVHYNLFENDGEFLL